MDKIKCLLVDDEPPAIELLEKYASLIDQLDVVGTAASAVNAFDFLSREQVDLIFLDIQMPVLNGIDFIKTLQHPPAIILTTAYREYAIDGYDLNIIDYLLKPIPFERFLRAVERYKSRFRSQPVTEVQNPSSPDYFFCNVNRNKHKIYFDQILFLESLKDYVRIHMREETLVVKGNLGSYMKILPSEKFIRIHRSYAVAHRLVSSFNQHEVHIGNQTIPLGGSYRATFQKIMGA